MPSPRAKSLPAILTAAVLAAMGVYVLAASGPAGGGEAYRKAVREAIDALPRRIDGYIGRDEAPLPGAIDLLRPNRILQRAYTHPLTGRSFSVLIVHCGDVRDMMGHYPPVCYPSNGWSVDAADPDAIDPHAGRSMPITRYTVSRSVGTTHRSRVIANSFILPQADTPFGRDDKSLDRVSRTRWSSGLGAAQVQIVTDASMPEDERRRIERLVAAELQGIVHAVTTTNQDAQPTEPTHHTRGSP